MFIGRVVEDLRLHFKHVVDDMEVVHYFKNFKKCLAWKDARVPSPATSSLTRTPQWMTDSHQPQVW